MGLHRVVDSWMGFQRHWAGVRNFLMAGECIPFDFDFPSIDRIVAELRAEPNARIGSGRKGDRLDVGDERDAFLKLPVDQALETPFSLAHFQLGVFDRPGGFLHGFRDAVLTPWEAALRDHGFTWDRCYPIVFISGPGCATNYHMDFSHVLAWQIYGEKRFNGLIDPDRWAPRQTRVSYSPNTFSRPAELTPADTLSYPMPPGTVLWNALLTPHWVEAGDTVAMSVNISHGGLRLHGQLCPHEAELEAHRQADPTRAPKPVAGTY